MPHEEPFPSEAPAVTPAPAPPAPPGSPWYGGSVLLADGLVVSGAVLLKLAGAPQGAIASTMVLGYTIAPPLVHLAHGSAPRTLGSLGLRLGAPALFALAGWAAYPCFMSDRCRNTGVGLGIVIGYASAVILDATALAWESRRPSKVRVAVLPQVGSTVGVVLLSTW